MIVLIEDSKTEQVKFLTWLKGEKVVVFETMREANDFLSNRRKEVKLIICDVYLPDANIYNTQLLKATFQDIPIMIISGSESLPTQYWKKTENRESFINETKKILSGG